MAQDDYIRTALRVPPDLHEALHKAADASGKSFNAEIIGRLIASFETDPTASAAALKVQTAMARTMAQFVISAIEIAGPQPPLTESVFRLMKETALQVKMSEKTDMLSPMGELIVRLKALIDTPEGADPEEFTDQAVSEYQRASEEKKVLIVKSQGLPRSKPRKLKS